MFSSPTIRCLAIPELRLAIVESVTCRAGLACLARTSRIWTEFALQRLWASQSSLINLLRCLPEHLVRFEEAGPGLVVVSVSDRIRESDFHRFRIYAAFVHSLSEDVASYMQPEVYVYDESVWSAIDCNVSGQLLPRLDTLQYPLGLLPGSQLHRFIGPKIRCLTMELMHDEESLDSDATDALNLLPTIHDACPNLACLRLDADEELTDDVAHTLSSRTWAVTDLDLGCVSLEALGVALVQNPRLERLHLTLAALSASELPRTDVALISLSIVCVSVADATRLLRALHCERLNTLSVSAQGACTPDTALDFFRTIAERCAPATLHTLSLDDGHPDPKCAAQWPALPTAAFAPLLAMRALQDVRVARHGAAVLDNAALVKMCGAWPRLRRLSIVSRAASEPASAGAVNLWGLSEAARLCPQLAHISVPCGPLLGLTDVERAVLADPARASKASVLEMYVGPLPAPTGEEAERVALALRTQFPKLEEIRWDLQTNGVVF